MAKFEVHIDLDNAAFGENATEEAQELARILRDIAKRLDNYFTASGGFAAIDSNGNGVGTAVRVPPLREDD